MTEEAARYVENNMEQNLKIAKGMKTNATTRIKSESK